MALITRVSKSLASTKEITKKTRKMGEFKAYSLKSHTPLAVEVNCEVSLVSKSENNSCPFTTGRTRTHEKSSCGQQPPWHTFQPNELPGPCALSQVGKKINTLPTASRKRGLV